MQTVSLGTEIVFLVWGCIWASISKCWRVTTVMGTWEHVEDLPSRVRWALSREIVSQISFFSPPLDYKLPLVERRYAASHMHFAGHEYMKCIYYFLAAERIWSPPSSEPEKSIEVQESKDSVPR